MVFCCVPLCGTDSWRCDPSITFHDFPHSPDLAAKWIQQINNALSSKEMWFPKAKSVVCSKHFLSTDYKDDSDSLKSRVVPTVFGYKYIGQNSEVEEVKPIARNFTSGPLIVKIKTEDGDKQDVLISEINSQNKLLEEIINEPENVEPNFSQTASVTPDIQGAFKTYSKSSPMGLKPYIHPAFQQSSGLQNIQTLLPLSREEKLTSSTLNTSQNLQSSFQQISDSNCENETYNINKTSLDNKGNKSSKVRKRELEKNNSSKKSAQKRDNNDNNLIEIGPNTFLKINPNIIKVNKKQTPSGNTVLQFLMDQKLANTIGTDVLPKIVQGAISNIGDTTNLIKNKSAELPSANPSGLSPTNDPENQKQDTVVQHVLGHLVDTHDCKETCSKLQEMDDILMETDGSGPENCLTDLDGNSISIEINSDPVENPNTVYNDDTHLRVDSDKSEPSCIAKAPVLLTTNMPLAHCFMEKTKYLTNLRQKARQIASLKQKVTCLNKKIEELEDKCIVQERQLSFSFLKKLRTIRKNASKGDPPATYILEQIRAYTGQKQMRWSDSTLQQCAMWCRKAPYAYEYFKKADFFKLPCLGTVKRFMKKHPEMLFYNKPVSNTGNGEDASSSDFNFDEEDSMDERDKEMNENKAEQVVCETVLSEETNNLHQTSGQNNSHISQLDKTNSMVDSNTVEVVFQRETATKNDTLKLDNSNETKTFPVTVDESSLEVQELILPSGEVVQCYSSNICNGGETNNQYYIIPSSGDQASGIEHEYSIVQSADSVPVILQNLDSSQVQQEQLIFITNSSDQVECTETEVMTVR